MEMKMKLLFCSNEREREKKTENEFIRPEQFQFTI